MSVAAPAATRWTALSRPGHFDGVATVVTKLLTAVEPDRLYLGQKDAQQAVILRRWSRDLDFGGPGRRLPHGPRDGRTGDARVATPISRPQERAWAPTLYATLRDAAVARSARGVAPARRPRPGCAAASPRGPGRLEYRGRVDIRTARRRRRPEARGSSPWPIGSAVGPPDRQRGRAARGGADELARRRSRRRAGNADELRSREGPAPPRRASPARRTSFRTAVAACRSRRPP